MASIECLTDKKNSDSLCTSTSPLSTDSDTTKCKRVECNNPSIDHPEWDGEYCSAQCLSSFCKDAFEQWVNKHQSMS